MSDIQITLKGTLKFDKSTLEPTALMLESVDEMADILPVLNEEEKESLKDKIIQQIPYEPEALEAGEFPAWELETVAEVYYKDAQSKEENREFDPVESGTKPWGNAEDIEITEIMLGDVNILPFISEEELTEIKEKLNA